VAATSLETALTDRALSIHTVAQEGQEGHIPNYADDRVSIDTHSRTASLGGTTTHPRGEFTTMMAEAAEADTQHSEQDYPTVTQSSSTIQCGRCNGNHLTRNCPDSEPCASCGLVIGSTAHPEAPCPFVCDRCTEFNEHIIKTTHEGGQLDGCVTNLCEACHETRPPTNPPCRNSHPITNTPTLVSFTRIPTSRAPNRFTRQLHMGLDTSHEGYPSPTTIPAAAITPTPLHYAQAVLREFANRQMADTLDLDEASRVGVEVMTVTERMTPDRAPRRHHYQMDTP